MKLWSDVALLAIAAVVLGAGGLAAHDRSVRSTEFASLRDAVASVEGLELLRLDAPGARPILERIGFDTPAQPSRARSYATLRVGEHGQARMVGLDEADFLDSEHFVLLSLGPYRFHYSGNGHFGVWEARSGKPVRSELYAPFVDFGRGGEFANALPFELRSLSDLVDNYDVALQFLDAWYASGRSIDATGRDGTIHTCSIRRYVD